VTTKQGAQSLKKIVLLIIAIGAAVWYFDIGRKMTEASIRESYQQQLDALQRFDAEPLCAALASDYTATVTTRGSGAAPQSKNKSEACSELARSLGRMKTLSKRTGGMLEPDYDFDIQSITLSPDRKLATVEIDSAMRLGDMTLSRGHSIEHLIRRNGRILHADSQDTVWVYRPQ
jgi:hypothetical protein